MKDTTIKKIAVVCLAICFGLTSCDDYLKEKDLPRLTPDYYGTVAGVESAATATYSYLRWGAGEERYNVITEYGTDLFTQGEDPGKYADGFNKYGSQLNPDAAVLYEFWENHYKAISTSNLVIQQVEASTSMTEVQKQSAIAEMSFLRGFLYFELVQQFGSIPLVLDVYFEVRTDFPRFSVSDIYTQIIKDLEYAVAYLPEKPAKTGKAARYAAAHLLAKVFLTRGSAINDQRGQQPTDMDNALKYARMVIESGQYSLLSNFTDLWDINNQGNKEVIFSIQFTTDPVYRDKGNSFHLYWGSWYEDQPGMKRDLENGRPYRRHLQTNKTMLELFDRKNDSRFYKSFKWAYYANREGAGLEIGDTAIYYSINPSTEAYRYKYFAWDKKIVAKNNRNYPPLLKYFDPLRISINDMPGGREWVKMRLGETYLIAAEAAGRKGDYTTAATYINIVRKRAAWQDNEQKIPQYWREEGGEAGNTNNTFSKIEVSTSNIQANFIDFMLDERGRELLGETCRWNDLVRCEKLEEYIKKWNPDASVTYKTHHKLRPIPQKHIDRLNPRGTDAEEQNPGYY
ncbi:RagB/SusD family nutrient uptake outer membrane protein [Massilibacteroides vaginae]|uniref:RagB/SusD family nutrient uptake outer membrane protein n=1 Tax=Massilibacteroides vaginae TaxID=1673718 RepID=UPI000A1CD3E3|nr:RagB/SusD family nutrient uptake outer membrane protein [Massilibacteroides vaginae]